MIQAEVIRLFKAITLAYPAFRVPEELAKEQISMWHGHLHDISYETAVDSLNQHVASNRFPPTIADIRSRLSEQTERQRMRDETESFFAQLELWQKNAAPPPGGMRERIYAMLRGGGQ